MSQLVACKACGKEIAKGVKKCPNCGKDQRNWFMRHKILSFIGILVILGIIGSIGVAEMILQQIHTASESKNEQANEKGRRKSVCGWRSCSSGPTRSNGF